MGVYPMLLTRHVSSLADFDKESWLEDVGAFLETCREMKIPASERPPGREDIFDVFDEAVPGG
jgi:hypothetical protein